jgi:ketosteroid isomerase-like protein
MSQHTRTTAVQQDLMAGWEAANYELDRTFLAAIASKNVEAAMSCFLDSSDLTVVLWGTEMRGPDQVRTAITQLFSSYDEVKLDIDRVTEFPSGDAVIAIGQATYTLRKENEATKITEVWTDVRREINGRWVYVLDHAEVIPAKASSNSSLS